MTLSKKYSTPIIVSIIVSVLAIGISLQGSTAETEEFDYKNSAINGIQFETTFKFPGIGNLSLETFSVYKQLSGFIKGESVSFRLGGLAGIDKIGLYELADRSTYQKFGSETHPLNNFDIDIKIMQNEQVLHDSDHRDRSGVQSSRRR